jgi:hypothetical protein
MLHRLRLGRVGLLSKTREVADLVFAFAGLLRLAALLPM